MDPVDTLSHDEIARRLASPGERASLIRAGAENGVAEAQLVYGQMLLDGDGVERDQSAAFGWFERAARAGNLMALNMLGRCYDLGWGTGVDQRRAAECFRVAADRGLAEGMYNWATALTLGTGVGEDKAAALDWFRRADALGYAKATNYVGSFHEDGWVVERDMGEAARCYAIAAGGGDFRGMFNHARMLIESGERDAALNWLERCGAAANPPFLAKAADWCLASPLGQAGADALMRGARP